MKKYIGLLFILFLTCWLISCTNKDESSDGQKLADAQNKYLQEIIYKNGSDEFITLLCIKYDLDANLTSKIIREFKQENPVQNYLSLLEPKTLEEFENLKTEINDRPSVEERIRRISLESNIDQTKIASLLVDYKIWYEAQDNESN